MNDGGNIGHSLADSAAYALFFRSGIFDIRKDGQDGVFIYRLQDNNSDLEVYWQLGEAHNRTACYIIIKDGVRYQFSMDENGWKFDNSKVYQTDLNRLTKNLALILTDRKADTKALATDLSGIAGIDLSKYFDFEILPTVLRSLVNSFEDESFQHAAGYAFERKDFTLQYAFCPTDSQKLAEYLNAIAKPAYTKKLQSILSISELANSVADLFGFDLYDLLLDGNISLSIGAFSGKLIQFEYATDNTTISAINRKYGGCQINIASEQLDALLKQHII